MKFEFIEENISNFRVMRMCRILKVSPSGYYAWLNRALSFHKLYNERLLTHIKVIHHKSKGTYGSPRITSALHDIGLNCGRGRVAGIMRRNSIRAKIKKKFKPVTTDSNHNLILPGICGHTEKSVISLIKKRKKVKDNGEVSI
jgi:putative transposase